MFSTTRNVLVEELWVLNFRVQLKNVTSQFYCNFWRNKLPLHYRTTVFVITLLILDYYVYIFNSFFCNHSYFERNIVTVMQNVLAR